MGPLMRCRRELLIALGALVVVSCSTVAGEPDGSVSVAPTVGGVGVLPPTVTAATTASSSPSTSTTELVIPSTVVPEGGATVGERAGGNRVLMIGDSILASVSSRYYGELCAALVPLDWQVQVEAEVGRHIEFAAEVLDELGVDESEEITAPSGTPPTTAPSGPARWDAGLIFLGTNYDRDGQEYLKRLNRAIIRFGAVPVVVVLVTEYDPAMLEVNGIIKSLDELYDNVTVIDWRSITASEARRNNPLFDGSPPPVTTPVLDATGRPIDVLAGDRIHLTDEGRVVLAEVIAGTFGRAPESPGRCLPPVFVEDPEPLPDGSGASTGTSPPPPPSTSSSTSSTSPPTSDAPTTSSSTPDPGGDGGGDAGGGDVDGGSVDGGDAGEGDGDG